MATDATADSLLRADMPRRRKPKNQLCRDAGISLPDDLTKQWREEARRRNMTLSRLTRIIMTEVFDNQSRWLPNVEMFLARKNGVPL